MKSFITLVVAAAGLLNLANASPSLQHSHLQSRQQQPPKKIHTGQYKTMTEKGCYSSNGGATLYTNDTFNTEGACQMNCVDIGKPMVLLGAGEECWCGDLMPNILTKVDNTKCNFPCPGNADNQKLRCGGLKNLWNVWNDALIPVDPDQAPAPTSSAPSPSGTPSPTGGNTPAAATTIVTTKPATTSGAASKSKSGPNVAAIAAGVVVGLVIIAAIAGGVFIYMRNQKRREIEEEHRRNAAVSSFTAGGKAPLSAGSSFSDTRLDPVVMARRESTGSIADNQDYSRRILKVTNA